MTKRSLLRNATRVAFYGLMLSLGWYVGHWGGAPQGSVPEAQMPSHAGARVAGWVARDGAGENTLAQGSSVRFVVRSFQSVTIASEMNARIIGLKLRDGDHFKSGEILVAFDCERTEAELASAIAVHAAHLVALETAQKLLAYGAGGSLAVDLARFDAEKSDGDVRGLRAKRAACTIIAPFDGRVVEKLGQAHEIATANQPILRIVDDSRPELALVVPSNWLGFVRIGTTFTADIDETGARHRATVSEIGGAIEAVSQTVRLVATIEPTGMPVLSGMSGTATFAIEGKN